MDITATRWRGPQTKGSYLLATSLTSIHNIGFYLREVRRQQQTEYPMWLSLVIKPFSQVSH